MLRLKTYVLLTSTPSTLFCRGFLPAEGSVAVCSRAPNYVAAHSTEPAQIVQQDDTNPLVRTLRLKKNVGKKRKGSPVSGAKCVSCPWVFLAFASSKM